MFRLLLIFAVALATFLAPSCQAEGCSVQWSGQAYETVCP